MKGIILAGGRATRLYPLTRAVCKQLLPVYDKPMIYYPLSTLMLAGINEVLIISTPLDLPRFYDLFKDGSSLGLKIFYARQENPRGIAEALIIAESFIKNSNVCLILGDNIFYGHDLGRILKQEGKLKAGAFVLAYYVNNPQRYGVFRFNREGRVTGLSEKPDKPASNWVATGLYIYDKRAAKIAKSLKPSKRGELEITDVNNYYLKRGGLKVQKLGRGYAWLDTGTPDTLIDASVFIKTIEERQGLKIGCVEEIAYREGLINKAQLKNLSRGINTEYGRYLRRLLDEEK